jgi:hypothetical protein
LIQLASGACEERRYGRDVVRGCQVSISVLYCGASSAANPFRSAPEERLRDRLRKDPELAEELAGFFDERREEQFFVKNLERVQGDERDAIILSIDYSKNDRGEPPYAQEAGCWGRAGQSARTASANPIST